jgi:hypothetical protein
MRSRMVRTQTQRDKQQITRNEVVRADYRNASEPTQNNGEQFALYNCRIENISRQLASA